MNDPINAAIKKANLDYTAGGFLREISMSGTLGKFSYGIIRVLTYTIYSIH
jgi:hypothetical protein